MQTQIERRGVGTGALVFVTAEGRAMVTHRMIMRDRARAIEARLAAAEWLAKNGTRPDRIEADRFLRGRVGYV